MSRAIRLFLAGFLSLVLVTSILILLFAKDETPSSGPVTQMEIYYSDSVNLTEIDPSN